MSIGRRVRVLLAVVGLSLAMALPVLAAQGPTKLEGPSVSPDSGSTSTQITFQVTYRSVKDLPPEYVRVTVAGATHAMTGDGSDWKGGVRFTWRGTLPNGSHDVVFKARDAEKFVDELYAGVVVIDGVTETPRPTPDPTDPPDPTNPPDPTHPPSPTPDPAPTSPAPSDDPTASAEPGASADPGTAPDPSVPAEPTPSGDPSDGGAGTLPPPDERDGWWLPADGGPGSGSGSGGGTGTGTGTGAGGGTSTDPGGSEIPVTPADDGGIAAVVGRWLGTIGDATRGTVGTLIDVLVGTGRPGSRADALGGGHGSLPTVPTIVLTSSGVGVWMAFMLFGKRRRDGEAPASDAVLRSAAATGSGIAGATVLPTLPIPMLDPEALMPRWRRPSLIEARKTDPVRAPAATRPSQSFDNAFGDIDPTMERRLVRYAAVQLLDRPDEVYAERIGDVGAGDEVAVVAQSGVYRQVRCPDGREGWVHRMTLGDVVVPIRDRGYDEDAHGPSIDAAGAMAALLAARGLR